MSYFCRISRSYEDLAEVFSSLTCKADALVVYEHEKDEEISRTHVHFYVEGSQITVEGIKKRVKAVCPDITKYDWSFNQKNVDRNCITYMSKGVLDPKMNRGGIDVSYYKDLWEEREKPKKYQTRLQFVTKESPSEAKKRKNDLIAEMMIVVGENGGDIIKAIIKVLNDNKIIFGRYTVRDYYDTISCRRNPDSFKEEMERFCCYRT